MHNICCSGVESKHISVAHKIGCKLYRAKAKVVDFFDPVTVDAKIKWAAPFFRYYSIIFTVLANIMAFICC